MANHDWTLWKAGRVLLWCSVRVCLFIGVGGGVLGAELDKISLYHTGRFNYGTTAVLVAIDKGFFAEEGLEVDFHYGLPSEAKVLEQIKGKTGVYGKVSSWGLRNEMDGQDFVAFASIYQSTNIGLLVNREAGIDSPRDLAGRRVMMSHSAVSAEIRTMMMNAGVVEGDFEWIRSPGGVEAFLSGEVDAVLARRNSQTIEALGKADVSWSMLLPAAHGVRFYWNVLATSRAEVDAHPERVEAFYRATIRGFLYSWTYPSEIVERYQHLDVIDGPKRSLMWNYLESQSAESLGRVDASHFGKMDKARWRQIADAYVALGEAEPVGSLDRFLFDPDPEPNLVWVEGIVGGAVCVVMLSLVVGMWNRQLSQRVQQRTASLMESETRRALMMKELDHRVKNNLATVLSLSKQTLDRADSLATFEEIFTGRLVTMAKSHEALAADAWTGIDLRYAARLAIEPYIAKAGHTVVVEGPEVKLPARAAIPVSMALHELATNAAKYGALCDGQEGGRVDLSWEVVEGEEVEILWRESGGPVVEGPIKPGVGMVLIKDLLEYDLNGRVEMAFEREGLCCKIRLPLEDGDQGLGDEGGEDSTLGAAPRVDEAPANSEEVNCLQG